jgi:hypothetical protein
LTLPYCRKCGTQLDEDSRFCRKCGTPISAAYNYSPVSPPTPPTPLRKDPVVIAAIVLVSILIVGVFVAALFSAPFAIVNIEQSVQENTANINTLNLNFQASAAKINIITQKINNNNYFISLEGSASKRIFDDDTGNPVQLNQNSNDVGGVLNSTVVLEESRAFSRLNLVCNIYVNPQLNLNLNITSNAGQISLTGQVQANFQNATISGNLTLKTQAGTVDFRMNQAKVEGNNSITLQTNAGSVNMDISETKTLQGNLQVNASTNLGSINLGLFVDSGVAAKITSQTNLGSIHVNQQNFLGDQSPIQSNNYPAQSNIEINNKTNLGSVNIDAKYHSSTNPSMRN